MTKKEETVRMYKEWEESINNMSAEEMKADLLNNCELSFTDSRKLKRNIADGLLRKMYKAYHPFVNSAEEGYNFIMRKYEGLLDTLYRVFDVEGAVQHEVTEAFQYSKEDLEGLNKERTQYRSDRSREILEEYKAKYSHDDVLEYLEDDTSISYGHKFDIEKVFSDLNKWAEE